MSSKQVTLVGYGWHLVPRIPFELGRLASGDAVIVHHLPPSPPKMRIAASGETIQIALGPATTSPEEVLHDFYDGQPLEGPGWSLGFERGYLLPWPAGTSVWSTGNHADWPVEFTLAGGLPDEMLYVQGPFDRTTAPALASLVGDDMTLVGRTQLAGVYGAIDAIEIRYVHEGDDWRQWRSLVPLRGDLVVLVTSQASDAGYPGMFAVGKTIATELR